MNKLKDRICNGQLCIGFLKAVVNSADVPFVGEWWSCQSGMLPMPRSLGVQLTLKYVFGWLFFFFKWIKLGILCSTCILKKTQNKPNQKPNKNQNPNQQS